MMFKITNTSISGLRTDGSNCLILAFEYKKEKGKISIENPSGKITIVYKKRKLISESADEMINIFPEYIELFHILNRYVRAVKATYEYSRERFILPSVNQKIAVDDSVVNIINLARMAYHERFKYKSQVFYILDGRAYIDRQDVTDELISAVRLVHMDGYIAYTYPKSLEEVKGLFINPFLNIGCLRTFQSKIAEIISGVEAHSLTVRLGDLTEVSWYFPISKKLLTSFKSKTAQDIIDIRKESLDNHRYLGWGLPNNFKVCKFGDSKLRPTNCRFSSQSGKLEIEWRIK
jgi:hypothetical protein